MDLKSYLDNLSKYHGDITEETRYLFIQIQGLKSLNKKDKEKEIKVLKEVLSVRGFPYAETRFLMQQLEEV